jgi:hypothetical protein
MKSNDYICGLRDARALFDSDASKPCSKNCSVKNWRLPRLEDCSCGNWNVRIGARNAQEAIDEKIGIAAGCFGHDTEKLCESCSRDTSKSTSIQAIEFLASCEPAVLEAAVAMLTPQEKDRLRHFLRGGKP